MSVEMHGLNELIASFDADVRTVSDEARKAVRLAAAGCERDAKTFAPVDTGNLRNSINTTITGNATFSRGVVRSDLEYALFVEEGTSRMAPHAFLGPAFDRNVPPFITALESITGRLQ